MNTLSSRDEWKALLRACKQANKLMVVSFKGGCQPCANMNQAIEKFANKYRDVRFLRIDLPAVKEVSKDLVEEFKVKKCPTVVLVKNEKQVHMIEGPYEEQLMSIIEIYKADEQSSEIVWLRSMDEWRLLLKACERKMMVVSFTCGGCQSCAIMRKALEKFANKYTDVQFVQVDLPPERRVSMALIREFKVAKCPTVVLVKDEKQVDKIVGPYEEQLMSKIDKYKFDEQSGKIVWLRTMDEWRVLLKACSERKMLMVVGFTTSWCQLCKMMEPVIEEFASKDIDVKFIKVDMGSPATGFSELAAQFEVCVYPTFILLKNEKQVDKIVLANKEELMKKIQKHKVFESDKFVAANNNDVVASQVITPRTLDEWKFQVKASTEANRLMVVGFTNPNGQQSKIIEKVLEEFAKKYRDVKFVKFGMASPPKGMDLVGQFQVQVCPTIILIKKGKQVDRVIGAKKDELNTKIATNRIQCGCEWR